jgi:uncharacterized protein (DUF433 family)
MISAAATREDMRFSMAFTRITVRAEQMGGVPCLRGLRIPVATTVGMVVSADTDFAESRRCQHLVPGTGC